MISICSGKKDARSIDGAAIPKAWRRLRSGMLPDLFVFLRLPRDIHRTSQGENGPFTKLRQTKTVFSGKPGK